VVQPEKKPPIKEAVEKIQPQPEPPQTTPLAIASPPPKPAPVKTLKPTDIQAKNSSPQASVTPKSKGPSDTKTAQNQSVFSESYNKGIRLVRAGDTQGALSTFQEAIALDPNGAEAAASHYWIGECHFAAGEYNSAADDFQSSLGYEVNAKHEAAMLMLGLTHLKLKQYDQAKSWFDKLLEQYPMGEYASCANTYLKSLNKIGK
jgi:TolA-binding protein